jgi:hypothetical protein
MAVDAQHVLEVNFACEFRPRLDAVGTLFDCQRAATGSKLSGDCAIDRHPTAKGRFASDYGDTRLKI